jgi:hypothetical protein
MLEAGPILPLGELRLAQARVAAHQHAVRTLVAGIHGEHLRARGRAGGDILSLEMDSAETVEDMEIAVAELLT